MGRRVDKYVLNCQETKYGTLDFETVDWSLYCQSQPESPTPSNNRPMKWIWFGKRTVRAFEWRKGIRDRWRTYRVPLRRVRVNTVAMEKHYYIFWVCCVCSLSHAACKAHAPYLIVICTLSGSNIIFYINSLTLWNLTTTIVVVPHR